MKNQLEFGIQTNGIKHTHLDPMPQIDKRFSMVKVASVFDYVDKTPEIEEIDLFLKASKKYKIPIKAGGWFYTIGEHKNLLKQNLKTAQSLGSKIHNTQIQSLNSDGNLVSNMEVRDAYLEAYDIGLKLGVTPCFEVHVNMWSEDFLRVVEVGNLVEDKGVEFNITLDHSHVIFKINNPGESTSLDNSGGDNLTRIKSILANAEIVKTFDLTNQSAIGNYIRNHVQDESFPEAPLTISFEKDEKSTYNGIDLTNGGFISKSEYLYNDFVKKDKPLIEANDFITDGFRRNSLASANILNLEFLFDDSFFSPETFFLVKNIKFQPDLSE